METLDAIRQWLSREGVAFEEMSHGPTYTSEEAAAARGEELHIGGKALLLKVDDGFRLFVISATRKLDSKRIKRAFKAKSIRFASRDE